jgi:hypothetical protein
LAKQIVNRKRKHGNKIIDRVAVDNGVLTLGEEGMMPSGVLKDGIYPVYLSADGCQITIDITPLPDGFEPSEYNYEDWKREVLKMKRKAATQRLTK